MQFPDRIWTLMHLGSPVVKVGSSANFSWASVGQWGAGSSRMTFPLFRVVPPPLKSWFHLVLGAEARKRESRCLWDLLRPNLAAGSLPLYPFGQSKLPGLSKFEERGIYPNSWTVSHYWGRRDSNWPERGGHMLSLVQRGKEYIHEGIISCFGTVCWMFVFKYISWSSKT